MTILSLTYPLSSWEENPGPLKGTTTPKVRVKQLWCTLGVVVLFELSIWLSLKVFLGKGKVGAGMGCNIETLCVLLALFLPLHSHITPRIDMHLSC